MNNVPVFLPPLSLRANICAPVNNRRGASSVDASSQQAACDLLSVQFHRFFLLVFACCVCELRCVFHISHCRHWRVDTRVANERSVYLNCKVLFGYFSRAECECCLFVLNESNTFPPLTGSAWFQFDTTTHDTHLLSVSKQIALEDSPRDRDFRTAVHSGTRTAKMRAITCAN